MPTGYESDDRQAAFNQGEADVVADRAARVLNELNVDVTSENLEQMKVYLMAFEIFLERNRRHRAQWRVGGIQGLLVDMRKKMERMWNEFMLSPVPPKDVDSPIDLINYGAFLVQALAEEKRGSRVGTWIWPTATDEKKEGGR